VERLRRADVVVYDNLANPDLLRYAPPTAEMIYAGKMADQHTKTQDEINTILADCAARGLNVVRLKGGDPFLFGRGGEEAAWLTENGIPWEMVPGVTSALAVPAYAGIPVTHRSVNGSLHVVTGHESMEGVGPDIDWSVLAKSTGTLIFLMGVKNLPIISRELMAHGMVGSTPAAMIRWGTLAEQETLVSRLDRIADDVAAAGLKPPAVGVIGHVVNLRETLAWVEKRPLFGTRVAVTRPLAENDTLARKLEELGAEVATTATLKVMPRELDSAGRELFRDIGAGRFDWIVITSGNGARLFSELLRREKKDGRWLAGIKLAVIGARTADTLARGGLIADLVVTDSHQEGLAEALLNEHPHAVLIARAATARPILEDRLAATGVESAVLPLYDTVPDEAGINRLLELLRRKKVHAVTFTSARTFEALAEAVQQRDAPETALPELLFGCAVAVIGPVTRASVEAAGVPVAVESPKADMESLATALVEHVKTLR
jgi:uroporphyrinogen III methyltransferase/synthase